MADVAEARGVLISSNIFTKFHRMGNVLVVQRQQMP